MIEKRMLERPQAEQEAIWRDRLARQAASGQSVNAFYEAEGVSGWAFTSGASGSPRHRR